jgi:hypothetical protein
MTNNTSETLWQRDRGRGRAVEPDIEANRLLTPSLKAWPQSEKRSPK